MNSDDWAVLLRCVDDKGLVAVSGDQQSGALTICGVCSMHLRCALHPKSGHKQPRPWPED